MDFINKDGQKGKFANQVAKFIGLPILFIIAFFEKTELSVFLLNTVEDDFFSICNGNKAKKFGQRLVSCDFLDIGIFRLVGLFCCLALVKHLKGDQTLDLSGSRLWDDPCRVEVLNRLQTWDNRGFQAGRCKDDEIVSECRILWFIICKIQIEIDECGHQICFSCTHREAEQIISVGYIVKNCLEKCVIVNA